LLHIGDMNRQATETRIIPTHDYRPALQSAVSWLGDRYLLAEPQQRRTADRPTYWTAAQHAAAHQARWRGR